MKTVNIYEAKTNLSKLLKRVQNGEEIVIAKAGIPIADLKPHLARKKEIKFGTAVGKLRYKDKDFDGLDTEIQEMFYGKDWNKDL